jgi:hypothetical protein
MAALKLFFWVQATFVLWTALWASRLRRAARAETAGDRASAADEHGMVVPTAAPRHA